MKRNSMAIIYLGLTALGSLVGDRPVAHAQEQLGIPKVQAGLREGETAPPFRARDQFGKEQNNATVAGKNGTVLLFFRSADW